MAAPVLLWPLLLCVTWQHSQERPTADASMREQWLRNMIVYHRYSDEEAAEVLAMPVEELARERVRLGLRPGERPLGPPDAPVVLLPYPGGRHPRIGFLDGAVNPQRETKISVFCPWDRHSYVVVDVPEAIWSHLGLTYLAHTHVKTIWEQRGIVLPRLEWKQPRDGMLTLERSLPNGIEFSTRVKAMAGQVRMEETLRNGTDQTLTDLRVQNCVMLKGAEGFNSQTNDNKVFRPPYVAVGDRDRQRWIITAWEPLHRAWANPPVPCLHSDPKFPDCPAGESRRLVGILSFFEGEDLDQELRRLDGSDWRNGIPDPIGD